MHGPVRFKMKALWMIAAVAACVAAWTPARAGNPSPLLETTTQVPDDADLVVIVSQASRLRAGPIGAMVEQAIGGTALGDVAKAWAGLSGELGWTKDETFDRLLGQRVVIVTRAAQPGGARQWAVLSEVSQETERRLFARLQASPRAIDAGHQILALEKGAYELTSHRRGGNRAGTSTIVLAPAAHKGGGGLFDELVRAFGVGAVRPLSRRAVFDAARASEGADVCILAAIGPAGPGLDGWSDFAVISAREEAETKGKGLGWNAHVVLRQARRKAELEQVRATGDGAYEALAQGALLAVVQSASVSRVLEAELPLMDLFRMLPIASVGAVGADGGAETRQMVSVRSTGAGGRTAVSVGMETSDIAATARLMDQRVASVAGTLEQRLGSQEPPPMDYGGAAPDAARVLRMRLPEEGPIGTMVGDPMVLAWAYPRAEGGAGGWWVLTAATSRDGEAPVAAEVLDAECRAVVGAAPSRMARWVWLGMVRARELEARLPVEVPDLRGFRSVMRGVEFAELRLWISDVGDLRGDMKVRLAERAGK